MPRPFAAQTVACFRSKRCLTSSFVLYRPGCGQEQTRIVFVCVLRFAHQGEPELAGAHCRRVAHDPGDVSMQSYRESRRALRSR